ncbi:MAG TPA: acyltransferase [Asticcacaulis sp.]|nr:acyltransferase [Asticcacaulis sp.]
MTLADQAPGSKARIAGFDGVRGICVLLVFFEHFIHSGNDVGGLGVKMFFALSGYLIVGILHSQRLRIESNKTTVIREIKTFWTNRIVRIFPVYYLTLFALLLFFVIKGRGLNYQGLGYYFFFLGNFHIQNISHSWGQFTHLWSLSVEQHFYMLMSVVIIFIPAFMHRWALLTFLGIASAFEIYAWTIWDLVDKPYVSDVPGFVYMAAGGAIALWPKNFSYRLFAKICGYCFVAACLLWAAINFGHFLKEGGAKVGLLQILSLIGCCCVLVYLPQRQGSILTKLLEFQPLAYLGKISYGFYIYHYFFHFAAQAAKVSFIPSPYGSILLVFAQFVFTCAVAAVSWELFEKRMLLFKRRSVTPVALNRDAVQS